MTRGERWLVWTAVLAVAVSGTGLAVLKYLLASADEFGVTIHPLEPLALKLHILTAPLLVFAIGMIAVRHVLAHLRQGIRAGRRSGLTALAALLPMIASGYAIQVVTDPAGLTVLAWLHGITGGAFAVGAAAHFAALRGQARARRRSAGRPEPVRGSAAGVP